MNGDPVGGNPYLPTFEPEAQLSRARGDDGLSPADRAVVEAVADGLPVRDAARAAGFHPDTGADLIRRPEARAALLAALRRRGLDEERIAKALRQGLRATRRVYDRHGNLMDETPDHTARHRYLNTLLEVRGDLERGTEGEETWETALMMVHRRRTGA